MSGARVRFGEWMVRVLGRPLEARGHGGVADAIVVLGAPLRSDGTLSAVVEERVHAGVELWRAGVAPVVCMTGGRAPGVVAARAEADVMRQRALELGVAESAVVIEARSANTSTNARNVKALWPGWRRVVVVTQPFHSRRARLWFARAGLEAEAHWIRDSLQYREWTRGLRWIGKEYLSIMRDLLVTRRAGEP